jgi:hypothetical protein
MQGSPQMAPLEAQRDPRAALIRSRLLADDDHRTNASLRCKCQPLAFSSRSASATSTPSRTALEMTRPRRSEKLMLTTSKTITSGL